MLSGASVKHSRGEVDEEVNSIIRVDDPISFEEALSGTKNEWNIDINCELHSFKSSKTWKFGSLPEGEYVIPVKRSLERN